MAIFEMDVPDAIGVAGIRLNRITTAESVVSCIETQSDEAGIGAFHQRVHFRGCLYIPSTVWMENGAESCLVSDRSCDTVCALYKRIPLRGC